MSFLSWLRNRNPIRSPRDGAYHRPAAARFRPRLEALDDRWLPSTLTVTSAADDGLAGTLRYEIAAAQSGDAIFFDPSLDGRTITLTGGELVIRQNLTIQGPGAGLLTITSRPDSSGGNGSRIFEVDGIGTAAALSGLTLSNGGGTANSGTGYGSVYDGYGGAVLNFGTLTVSDSTLTGNAAPNYDYTDQGWGGGISNYGGTLTVSNSTLSGNYAGYAGGGISNYLGTLTVSDSTLSGNATYGDCYVYGGGIFNDGTATVSNSTLSGNYAGDSGGGIFTEGGTLTVGNTIVAGNDAASDPSWDVCGGFSSLGSNLIGIGDGATGFGAAGDRVGTGASPIDPLLGPLQDNGGPTQTMALLPGSPAVDAGDNVLAVDANGNPLASDQRGPGFPRVVNGTVDIGAFEAQNRQGLLAVVGFPTTATAGLAGSLTVTALNADGSTDTGYTGTVYLTSTDPRAVLPAGYTFTAADRGTHTFTVTLMTAGTQSLAAREAETGITGAEGGITVTPAAAGSLVVAGFPSSVAAGQAGTFTVTALDPYGNVATGYTGVVHFSSSDGRAVLPADAALGNGVGQFGATLETIGYQSITATDAANSGLTGSETGVRVNPLAGISGPAASRINQTLTFTLTAGGDPAGTAYTFRIDWDGDGLVDQTVGGPSGTAVTHAYATAGWRTVGVTATDPGSFTSPEATTSVNILPVSATILTDPADSTRQVLVIGGSADGDRIVLGSGANNGVTLSFDGADLGTVLPTNGSPFALVEVFGEGGDDTLDGRGLGISSALVGGSGNDTLYGGSGRNLLIGGLGSDTLYAGGGGDILIGGTTSDDNNPTALAFVMAEWDRADVSYSARVKHLQGGLAGGLNGLYVLNATTVLDDGATDALYGGAGLDWYFAHQKGKKDSVYGLSGGEAVTGI